MELKDSSPTGHKEAEVPCIESALKDRSHAWLLSKKERNAALHQILVYKTFFKVNKHKKLWMKKRNARESKTLSI